MAGGRVGAVRAHHDRRRGDWPRGWRSAVAGSRTRTGRGHAGARGRLLGCIAGALGSSPGPGDDPGLPGPEPRYHSAALPGPGGAMRGDRDRVVGQGSKTADRGGRPSGAGFREQWHGRRRVGSAPARRRPAHHAGRPARGSAPGAGAGLPRPGVRPGSAKQLGTRCPGTPAGLGTVLESLGLAVPVAASDRYPDAIRGAPSRGTCPHADQRGARLAAPTGRTHAAGRLGGGASA